MNKKKNTALLIDGENISHRKTEKILAAAKGQGVLDERQVCVYEMKNDRINKGWIQKEKENKIRFIGVSGEPAKDKVDKEIQKDAFKITNHMKNIDIVVIATSDKGYVKSINKLREKGKRVVVVGEAKAPATLRDAANKFVEV